MFINYNTFKPPLYKPLITTTLRTTSNLVLMNTNNNSKPILHPFPGLEIGVPLNIFQFVFTRLFYNTNIMNLRTILFQFTTAYFSYGFDRLVDSYEINNVTNINYNNTNYDKYNLYKFIQNNELFIINTIIIAFFYDIDVLLSNEKTYPFIVLLLSTFFYKDFKLNYSLLKPIYIGILWTVSSIIIPCVLYENNYNIVLHPEIYLPCFLTLFASSNLIDIKDIEEDFENSIFTIPIKFGIKNAIIISYISIIISSLLIFTNENYHNNLIINDIYLFQNLGLFFLPLSFNISNSRNITY